MQNPHARFNVANPDRPGRGPLWTVTARRKGSMGLVIRHDLNSGDDEAAGSAGEIATPLLLPADKRSIII